MEDHSTEICSFKLWMNDRSGDGTGVLPPCMECQRGLVTRKMSVCPSIRSSVKRVDCDKTEERPVQIFYHTKYHYSFGRRSMVVGGDPPEISG